MKCPLCGHQFQEEEAEFACKGCPMAVGCHMIKCPNCGYDVPREPGLIKAFKVWKRRKEDGTNGES